MCEGARQKATTEILDFVQNDESKWDFVQNDEPKWDSVRAGL
jgi:hypothetical protein